MPRAHLSKRLDDATAIQLFAEHHIVHVRRRKNGEIVAVKHSTFGWMGTEQYYALQKAHDLLPVLQEFIRGGYMMKLAFINSNISVSGVNLPIGIGLYGGVIGTAVPLALSVPKEGISDEARAKAQRLIDTARLCLLAVALPYGDLFVPGLYMNIVQDAISLASEVVPSSGNPFIDAWVTLPGTILRLFGIH